MSSPLQRFSQAAFQKSKAVIGSTIFTIEDGAGVPCINGEAQVNRNTNYGGFDNEDTLTITCSSTEFTEVYTLNAEDYLGKLAEINGLEWRISNITSGDFFTDIVLINPSQGS